MEAQFRSMISSNQAALGALQFETSQASARSQEVKRWMEHLQATGGGTAEHPGFFQSAPTKILFAGADFLLTASFRGGLGGLKQGPVGPRPLSDSALGLARPSDHTFELAEVVKGDSQKADDAAVPDQLWLHAFLGGYAERDPPSGWQASMPGFRAFGLRYWRRQAVRGYFNWRHSNIPWQSNLPTPAQMVRWRMGMAFGRVRPVYEWTAKATIRTGAY